MGVREQMVKPATELAGEFHHESMPSPLLRLCPAKIYFSAITRYQYLLRDRSRVHSECGGVGWIGQCDHTSSSANRQQLPGPGQLAAKHNQHHPGTFQLSGQ
jgi:hypothetical protein